MAVGSDAVLGGCISGCCRSGEGHHRHGPGAHRDDGEVCINQSFTQTFIITEYQLELRSYTLTWRVRDFNMTKTVDHILYK